MITHIDLLTGDNFRKVSSDFAVVVKQFAESHNMNDFAMKQFVAHIGDCYEYELQRGNDRIL